MSSSYLNLPNLLSFSRLIISPLLFYLPEFLLPYFFILLALTDALDGYLARRLRQETALGRVLDPLGDKTLLLSALYVCSFKLYKTPPILFWSLLGRDLFILLGGLFLYLKTKQVPKPSLLGKISTAFMSLSIPLCMLTRDPYLLTLIFYSSYSLIVLSWMDYALRGFKTLKNQTSF